MAAESRALGANGLVAFFAVIRIRDAIFTANEAMATAALLHDAAERLMTSELRTLRAKLS